MSKKQSFSRNRARSSGLSIPKPGSRWYLRGDKEEIVVLPYKGRGILFYYRVSTLVIHRMPLDQFYTAFNFIRNAREGEDFMSCLGSASVDVSKYPRVIASEPKSHEEVMNAMQQIRQGRASNRTIGLVNGYQVPIGTKKGAK